MSRRIGVFVSGRRLDQRAVGAGGIGGAFCGGARSGVGDEDVDVVVILVIVVVVVVVVDAAAEPEIVASADVAVATAAVLRLLMSHQIEIFVSGR